MNNPVNMSEEMDELVYRGTLNLHNFITRGDEPLDGDMVEQIGERVKEYLNQFNGND